MNQSPSAFCSVPATDLLRQLGATPRGLASSEARERLTRFGANLLAPKRRTDELALLLGQFESPLMLILLLAAGLSFFLHDPAWLGHESWPTSRLSSPGATGGSS